MKKHFEKFPFKDMTIDRDFMNRRFVSFTNSYLWKYLVKIIRECYGSAAGIRSIEVGCGTGTLSLMLSLLGAEVTLMDIDDDALDAAKKAFSLYNCRGSFIKASIAESSPDTLKGKFDIAASGGLIEHFTGPARENVIRRHAEFLRPGGLVYLSVPNMLSLPYWAVRAASTIAGEWDIETEVPFTPGELRRIGGNIGFSETYVRGLYDLKQDYTMHTAAVGSKVFHMLPSGMVKLLKKGPLYRSCKDTRPLDLPPSFVADNAAELYENKEIDIRNDFLKDIICSNIILIGILKK
jgi:2-polyprenyl-3-methyl-5-hydroxy-6-metoxy-1,4-benzoquinol methylase